MGRKTDYLHIHNGPKLPIAPIAAGIAATAVSLYAGEFFYRLCLTQKTDKSKVFSAPHNRPTDAPPSTVERDMEWLSTQPVKEQNILAEDGIRLRAILLENPARGPWVILCHGYTGHAEEMADFAHEFYKRGYQILMPDARGHGKSDGDYIGMGWPDRRDLVCWSKYLVRNKQALDIVLFGISMGGAQVMMASGENLPVQVRAVVEDCGYTCAWDEFYYQMKMLYHLPAFPFLYTMDLFTRIHAGYGLKEASALRQVAKCRIPMLFIHGGKDALVPYRMLEPLYEAAVCEKERFAVKEAGHGESRQVEPQAYWEKVFSFLEKAIPHKYFG